MKLTTIKFPIEHEKVELGRVGNRVFDFLIASVIDGDLELDETDLRTMMVTRYKFESSYEDEGELYDIFDVEIQGEDRAIQNLDTWFEQFDKPLH